MGLDEHIEILNQILAWSSPNYNPAVKGAIQMGIEALKRLQLLRQFPRDEFWHKLPGETEK